MPQTKFFRLFSAALLTAAAASVSAETAVTPALTGQTETVQASAEVQKSALQASADDDAVLDDASILKRWPEGSINSHAAAEKALDDVDASRLRLKESAARLHDGCIDRFFVNACWDKLRDRQFQRGREFRRIELEAKDFLRAENAEKERVRKLEVRAEAGEKVTEADVSAALAPQTDAERMRAARISAEERVAEANKRAEEKKAKELQSEADYEKRQSDLDARRKKGEENRAAAAERVADAEKTRARVEANRAKAAEKVAAESDAVKQWDARQAEAKQREASAKANAAENEAKRAARAARLEEDKRRRLEAQKNYEEDREKRSHSLNPFQ